MLKKVVVGICLILLPIISGCKTTNLPNNPQPINFNSVQKFAVSAKSLEVIDNTKYTYQQPNIEHLLPYKINDEIRDWVNEKFILSGDKNHLRVIIKDATVIKNAPKKNKHFKELLTVKPDEFYRTNLILFIGLYENKDETTPLAEIEIENFFENTLYEDATFQERQQLMAEIGRHSIDQLDQMVNSNFNRYFVKYLAR